MQKITPFLWFDGTLEEAVNFYVSIFPDAKVLSMNRQGPSGPVFSATFQLAGSTFMGLNGGPMYKFSEAISFFVSCETQAEIDSLWDQLLAGGGTPTQCGWLKDRFGLSWQVVPSALGELLGGSDPARSQRVMQAMMKMVKFDIQGLKDAAAQP